MAGGRPCAICQHAERAAIDEALVRGESFRNVSKRWGMSPAAALRHRSDHLAATMAQARTDQAAAEAKHGEDLVDQVRILRTKALSILVTAEKAGDLRTALLAIRSARESIELLLEVEQRVDRRPVTKVLLTADWLAVEAALVDALRPFPPARLAVVERLDALRPS